MREPAPTNLPPRLPPRIVVWLLRRRGTLAAFVGAAILSDLSLPLALAPNRWRQGAQNQLSALLQLVQTYPLQSLGVAALLVALMLAVVLANQRERAAEKPTALAQTATMVGIQQGQEQLAIGQAGNDALGAEILATAQQTQARIESLHDALRAEIGQLAQRAARAERAGITRRIFLSSTAVDLAAHRRAVHDTLERMNQFAVDMAQFGAGDADATTVSLRKLATADIVVLIVAWRYGFIPQGQTRSITQLEYEEALRRGVPIFIYLADTATEADTSPTALFPASSRNPQQAVQLAAFRATLSDSDTHTYDTFTTPDDLAKKVAAALGSYLLDAQRLAELPRPDDSGRAVALADMPAPGSLIGRDEALHDLAQRLVAGEAVGVFALEGMGGVGKTALAAAAVERFADDTQAFPGGVAWLACAGLEGDAGLLALLAQVARLLGHDDIAKLTDLSQLRQALSAALRGRPSTLLALDNVEPGLDTEAALRTLTARGHTTLLLTAREQVVPSLVYAVRLAPLPTPDAARLFAQRLRQDTGGARPTPDDAPQIPALVEAVGGLPLAVELLAAAGRQGIQLATLRAELDALGVNASAFHVDPTRALTRTFDRSWVTLPERLRRLFAGLGLLPESGFPRAAAHAVALAAAPNESAPPTAAQRPPDPAGDVAALVRAALVEPLGGERLRLHPLLRAYANDRLTELTPETGDALGDALLAFWLEYARAHPSGRGQNVAAMNALEAEAPGLMGALAWAHNHARWRALLDLVDALNSAWYMRGRRAEERRFLPWAVEAARALDDRAETRRALQELAVLDAQTGDPQRARAGYEEALALAYELDDKSAIRTELHGLAARYAKEGYPQFARELYEKALALAYELDDMRAIRLELHGLAARDAADGNTQLALKRYEEALTIARRLVDKRAIRTETHGLAVRYAKDGNPQRARELYNEALALAYELDDMRAIRLELHGLAARDAEEGDLPNARIGYEKALKLARDLNDPASQSKELQKLGALNLRLGEANRAQSELEEALRLARQVEQPALIAEAARWLAELESERGQREEACAGFREALAIYERLGNPDAATARERLRELGCES